ncbi:MAG: DNA-3-methyladenine glycosylase 2 family protein [Saprospiraceae bacterium]|nr:DNA-3-methyladenine glycosylase 2 family protein [Saprospiraceae bacterium]
MPLEKNQASKAAILSQLLKADEVLAAIIQQQQYPEIPSTGNVFNDLVSCVIEQQIHYRSTRHRFSKWLAELGLTELTLDSFELFEAKILSKLKLSHRKYETLAAVLRFFQEKEVDWHNKEEEEIRKQLSEIRGIGNWTVDMILLYTLEYPNIFPAQDFHLKKRMQAFYEISPQDNLLTSMRTIANNWAPHRSTAVKYLLHLAPLSQQ